MSQLFTLGRARLVASETGDAPVVPAQPKRLALLAYLAITTAREQREVPRRDTLLALFWPELDEAEGRRALRQAMYYLRRTAGDVFATDADEVAIRGDALRCDAVEFERQVSAGDPAGALTLYRGDFLAGFHVDDVSAEFEEWVERTRARLRRAAATAAWSAADAAETRGDAAAAVELGRRVCELEPEQEGGWRRLMLLHQRLGDRSGALHAYDELARRLAREYDATPSPETVALAEAIRTSSTQPDLPALPRAAPTASIDGVIATAPAPGTADLGRGDAEQPATSQNASRPLTGRPATPEHGPRRRRLFLAGLAVVVVLGGAALAYMALAAPRDGPSLLSEGALARKDRLIVADFVDQAGDPMLAAALTEAFRIDLSQSPLVAVLTPQRVRASLTLMQRPPDARVDDSLAREVAVREGAKAIVTGIVARVGPAYTVTAQLVGTERGEGLAAFRATAADSSELIGAVDRLSEQLRHRIGESLRDLRAAEPLLEVTTASLDALKKFTEGMRLNLAGRRTEAIALFHEAVALDTSFASAYLALGMAYDAIAEPGRSAAALRQAVAHHRRLPFIERSFTIASNAAGRGDLDTAIDAYRRFLERYPDDYRALNNLALIYRERRQLATAESLFVRAAGIDSTIPNFYFGIHSTQMLEGRFAESRRTLDLIARRFPDNPVLGNVEIQDASAQQNWELAARHAEATIAAAKGDTLALIDPFEALAAILMTQGQLAAARQHWRTHLTLSKATASHGRHLFGVLQVGYLELRHRNAPERALAFVDSAVAAVSLASLLPADRPYDALARFYAAAGRLTRARELARAADANDRELGRDRHAERSWTQGVISLAEGRGVDAERLLQPAAEVHPCTICVLPDLARAYEATGKPEAAAVVYERYTTTPWFWRYEVDASELGWVLERLGELYDARGETERASSARGRLVQLWRRADPELQPVVSEARRRLTSGPS